MNKIEQFINFLRENRYLNELEIKDNKLTVRGSLYLGGTQIKELPENLTVGGSLYLRGTQIKELPENLTVGGGLDLRGTQIKELPNSLIAYSVYKNEEIIILNNIKRGYNKERKYIYFDGILWGNVKSVKKRENITIYKTPLGYCVVKEELSAHGKNLREAIEDLTFKKLRNTDKAEIVKEINKTGKVTRLQYRAITGACRMGTEAFCRKNNIKEEQEEISLEELEKILTPENYGARTFWNLIKGEM